jgi:STIP1 family protein 1
MSSYAAEQLKEKGNASFRNGEYQEAEDFYTQAIQRYSKNQLIFTNRANVRLKLQKYDAAVNDCLKSIEITGARGHNHKAFYFLGEFGELFLVGSDWQAVTFAGNVADNRGREAGLRP